MRIDELKEKIKGLTGEIRNLTNSKDIDGAKAKMEELRQLKETLKIEEAYLDSEANCRSFELHNKEVEKAKELRDLEKEIELLEIEAELL
ncbi:hypothetical protein ACHM2G_05530 [Clostridium perfringens]|uniref:hypothetical protein n=1 Tax=Clostridium perfringens TaxID=1502 RepID=UPI001FB1121F|nr:hypothetical protein [Clostridium perfringens]MDK0596123.1 hypothetical protein [Clostridium perfringens]MDK0943410.1 hypothetical protein [Clostridium perfringens]MDM0648934.1 hypothetical protein [Clostridium perfringens]